MPGRLETAHDELLRAAERSRRAEGVTGSLLNRGLCSFATGSLEGLGTHDHKKERAMLKCIKVTEAPFRKSASIQIAADLEIRQSHSIRLCLDLDRSKQI